MKKEKPTREERLNAYEFAREWLNDNMDNTVGICSLIRRATDPNRLILSDFPEFIEAKPKDKDVGGYWFSSAKERIQVLTEIINKMKEEPFKKSKWQRIKDILEDPECEKWEDDEEKPEQTSTGINNTNEFITNLLVEIAEISKERNELREELRVLREEVEELKQREIDKEKQESINQIHEIMRESLATKECCKEKPKESEDLKIKWNHSELCIEENKLLKYLNLRINDGRDNCSIPIEKPEAINIVNYLKKHFEIES